MYIAPSSGCLLLNLYVPINLFYVTTFSSAVHHLMTAQRLAQWQPVINILFSYIAQIFYFLPEIWTIMW